MRDRDLDLISALVEGRLEDETAARALIESSEEARAEYEAQLLAHEALSGLGPARMTQAERAALHRDVWTALRSRPVEKAPSSSWFTRWVPAAAAVAAVVMVGVVATMGGGADGGGGLVEIAADHGASETTAAASEEARDGDGGDMTPLSAPTSTAGESTGGGAPAYDEAAFYSAEAERIRATDPLSPSTDPQESEVERCLRDAGLQDHVPADTVEPPEQTDGARTVIAAVPAGADLKEATVTFVDRATCEVVFVDE